MVPTAVRRSAHHGLILAAVALTVLLSGTVLAALTALATTSVDAGAARRLAATPGAQVLVGADYRNSGLAAADRAVRAATARVFGDVPQRTGIGLLDASPVFAVGVDGSDGTALGPGGSRLHPVAVQGAADYGRLTSGHWPAGVGGEVPSSAFTGLPEVRPGAGATAPVDAAVPWQLAQRLGLKPGSSLRVLDAFGRAQTLRITGVYRATGPVGFWPDMAGDPSGSTGDEQNLLVVAPAAVNGNAALNGQLAVRWGAQPDLAQLDATTLAGLRDRVRAFSGSQTGLSVFRGATPALDNMKVDSNLPQAIDALAAPTLVARSALYLPTALLASLALTALVLTARQLTTHRRGELALQQARGAGTPRLLRAAAAEWAVTGVPAAVAAPFLADLLQPGALGPAAWAAVGLTLLVHGASVLLPVLPPPRLRIGRGARAAVAQRAGADLALAAVAALGYLALRNDHGVAADPSGSGPAVDPVLVLVPVLAAGAAALLLLRLLPLTSRLLDLLGRRGRGLVAPLAGWQLSRRAARNAGPVVLMCLAVSVGALATTALACLDGLAEDQAGFSVGADVRIDASGGGSYPATVLPAAYAALPGVTALTPVTRTSANVPGGTTVDVIGTVPGGHPGTAAGPFGTVLPGRPTGLVLDETLRSDGDTAAPRLVLTVQDAYGLVSTVSTALPAADGRRHRVAVPLDVDSSGGHARSYPLTVTAVTVRPQPDRRPARLTLSLHRIGSANSTNNTNSPGSTVGADAWAAALPPGLAWADRTSGAASATAGACRGRLDDPAYQFGDPGVCAIGTGPDLLDLSLSTGFGGSPASAGLPGDQPLPTGANAALLLVTAPTGPPKPLPLRADAIALRDGHLHVGQHFLLGVGDGPGLPVTVVGAVGPIPGLGSGQGHLLADQRQLAAVLSYAGVAQQDPVFWWLTSADSARTDAAAAAQPALGNSSTRGQVAAELRSDPFRSGLRTVLELSRILAPCFAVVGFTVHAVVSARERRREFALLRAMGVRAGGLSALLAGEQLGIALFAVLPGTLIGTALAGAVLPLITVDDAGRPPYPPLRLVLPWGRVGLTSLLTAGAICLVVLAMARLLARVDLVRVLRAGESG